MEAHVTDTVWLLLWQGLSFMHHYCSACNAVQVANSWRTTADIAASWDSILRCLDNTIGLSRFAGPGAWNDPDMLEVNLVLPCPVLCCAVLAYFKRVAHQKCAAHLGVPLVGSLDCISIAHYSCRAIICMSGRYLKVLQACRMVSFCDGKEMLQKG